MSLLRRAGLTALRNTARRPVIALDAKGRRVAAGRAVREADDEVLAWLAEDGAEWMIEAATEELARRERARGWAA